VKPVGEPDAVAPHVRFDERGWETGRWPLALSYRAHPRLYRKGLASASGGRPLLRAKRNSRLRAPTSEFDPKATSAIARATTAQSSRACRARAGTYDGGWNCVVGCLILHCWKLQNAAVWFPDGNKQSEVQQHGNIEAGHASRIPAGDTACDGSERGRGEPDQPCTNHHPAPGGRAMASASQDS
jgi:hypothetical protein